MSVFVTKSVGDLKDCVRRVFAAFGERFDFGKGFFLKPNIVFPVKPNGGVITRPAVLQATIEVLRELKPDVDIVLGEGTAAGTVPAENFRVSGYAGLARRLGVPLVNLDRSERVAVSWYTGRLPLPRLALERNYVSLAILKPSSAAGISGAMKNQKGILSPGMKKRFHKLGLDLPLVELNRVVQPQLTILDGWNFFEPELLIAGEHTVDVDVAACQLLGIDAVDHVRLAQEAGLGSPAVEIRGDRPQLVRNARTLRRRDCRQLGRLRLWSNPGACSMCRFLFQRIREQPWRYASLAAGLKLLPYAAWGADVVMGSNPKFTGGGRKVVCIGNCTRELAQRNGYVHVPGCPPTLEDLCRGL